MKSDSAENAFNRREFIRLTLMSSAILMDAGLGAHGAETEPAAGSHAILHPLPPGAVQPQGWLRRYLEKQATQLGAQLPRVSWPFTGTYWDGEENGEAGNSDAWWPWEQKAYWIDGATRLAIVLQDRQLMAQTRASIDYTLSHADADGYLGPHYFKDPKGDFHRWPQNIFFRSLTAVGDAQSLPGPVESSDIAQALRKHYLGDTASYGTPIRNVTNIEAMLWTYGRTGDPRLLALAENAWQEYEKATTKEWKDCCVAAAYDLEYGDLSPERVFADTPIYAHGVTYAETAKLPAILYLHTGNEEYLKFAQAAQRRIFDNHMLIDGIPSTSEYFRTTTALDSHETCDIAEHTWSWGYMLMATGDTVWADRIERACFNAAPGAIKNDWKALQYFSCPNQFLATLNSDHNVMTHGGRMMAYQPNPGQRTACCGGNVHRILPNYAIRMWMKTNQNGLAAVLYGPSEVKATVGPDNQEIEIVQTTNYPFDEQIQFKIASARSVAFPLLFRIPSWCGEPRITLNGSQVPVTRASGGFLRIERTFHPDDVVTLTLPMKVAVTHWPENGVGIERGPLVYSLPIEENWTSRVEPTFTTADFPSWEATAASAWNYALALDPSKLNSEVEFTSRPAEQNGELDPWDNPPVALTVPARRIEDWQLQSNPDDPSQKFTPALPDVSSSKISPAVERVTLVPYGSTQLRLTIFPTVGG